MDFYWDVIGLSFIRTKDCEYPTTLIVSNKFSVSSEKVNGSYMNMLQKMTFLPTKNFNYVKVHHKSSHLCLIDKAQWISSMNEANVIALGV